jgi:Mn-dependent DtxR family transcriptional regulator
MWIVKSAPPKQEIARMIGASREMVSRVVKDLQDRGYIRTEKRKVYLLDKGSMMKRAPTARSADVSTSFGARAERI